LFSNPMSNHWVHPRPVTTVDLHVFFVHFASWWTLFFSPPPFHTSGEWLGSRLPLTSPLPCSASVAHGATQVFPFFPFQSRDSLSCVTPLSTFPITGTPSKFPLIDHTRYLPPPFLVGLCGQCTVRVHFGSLSAHPLTTPPVHRKEVALFFLLVLFSFGPSPFPPLQSRPCLLLRQALILL